MLIEQIKQYELSQRKNTQLVKQGGHFFYNLKKIRKCPSYETLLCGSTSYCLQNKIAFPLNKSVLFF